jgi:hypothetical protein
MKANGRRQVDDRLARLEKEMQQLRTEFQQCKQVGWRNIVGSHRGSKTFDHIIRAIRSHRRDDYAAASATSAKRGSARTATVTEE